MKAKEGIVVFILAAALLVSMVGVVSASQKWDLDQNDIMYKGAHVETGTVTIVEGGSNNWTAENAAKGKLKFDSEAWNGQLELWTGQPSTTKKFTVEIGIWDGSSFSSKGKSDEYDFNRPDGKGRPYFLDAPDFTVPKGQWLAVRVNNTGTGSFELDTDGSCYITYPPDHPDYPNPRPDLNVTGKFEEWVNETHFNVNYTVANIGGGDAGASNTTIYIDGTAVMEDSVPGLAVGKNYTNTVGPFECPCDQTLNITVCADNDDDVEESDETNNCMVNFVDCLPCPKPDLNVTGKFEEWVNETHFNVNYTVANIGGGDAGASNTTIYIDGTAVREDSVPGLAVGEDYTNTVGPFECPCDQTLNVTVCADNDDVVEESDETNNCMVNFVDCLPCPGPDLNVTGKFEEWVNETHFNVNYTVANIGGGDAGASNTTIYIDGTAVREDSVPGLAVGEDYTNTVGPFECPCDQTLNVTVCADNDDVVEESDETNNCMVNFVDCLPCPGPDLNVTGKFEEWVNETHFNVNYTVANIGGGDAGASNTTIYIDGTAVMEDSVPGLAVGKNYTNTVGPFECPCDQTLNITVCADNDDDVEESDETNNCMVNELECPPCLMPPPVPVPVYSRTGMLVLIAIMCIATTVVLKRKKQNKN